MVPQPGLNPHQTSSRVTRRAHIGWRLILIAVLAGVCCEKGELEQQQREREQLSRMLGELADLQTECDSTELVSTVPIRGKVLVWSVFEGIRLDQVEPSQLAATSLNEPMTVFLVKSRREDRGWFFTNANDEFQTVLRLRAYRSDMDLCAVYWPEKTLAGRVALEGAEPPTRGGEPIAEHGKPPDIKAWILQQPLESP